MTWTIVEGPYADSELTDVIVLDGSSQAVTFGKRKLRTIAIAVGHQNPSYVKDTDEFMNIPCIVKVGFGKPGTSYEDVSQIYQYLPLSSRPAVNTMGGSVAVPPKTNKVPPPGTQRAPVAPPQRAVPPNGGRVPPPTNGYKPQAGKKEFMDKGVPDVPEYGEEQSPDNPPF
jgi:hypothetical protein